MTLRDSLQQARINYLRVIEAGDFEDHDLVKSHTKGLLYEFMHIKFDPIVFYDFFNIYKGRIVLKDKRIGRPVELIEKYRKQALLDRVELIDKLLKELEPDVAEESEIKCIGCGVSLDNESEYLQTEGYCNDCL